MMQQDGRCHLLMDADDTLWENNIYFEQAIHAFVTFLDHSRLSQDEVRAVLDDIQRQNIQRRQGYGSASFTMSLLEAYHRLAEKDIKEDDLQQVRQIAAQLHAHPLQLIEGVRETLNYLAPRHDLFLLTKGDTAEQQLKIERSGIEAFFRQVVIVPEKNRATYHDVVSELGLLPQQTWMVGNSPRSDINPALAAGLNAVFIPHPHTWRLEHEEVQQTEMGRLLTLSTFTDLRNHF